MKVEFRKKKLEKCFKHKKQATKEFGDQVARKYIQRIEIIKSVANLDDLKGMPGLRCHPLKGKRQGQYAVKLTGFYRLIFTVDGDCLNIAMIEEVSKHYDD
ncbi:MULTISPECIES: type II toxin-antitoxin system RelE/ParE family toxin [unclassified Marinobacter]|uniref:type II toxin-antitoxin system RelE/ParE family toxin n=1 Tax=unclassified Marinobacter TaxID=83889 RepID=UPI0020101A97|nr:MULTISPECIES: type II toxin-antitoxin system RelE/ParE family toxin [unclassified Marinobacter]MCL1480502.1 type II toxin-antitoxin system RelE/ParE family toxin [Marinobacter sp.]MCL1487819.1 type II toxin-antitoxin system RelE/ParE family toxin [Marinobacter sp.]UQG56292.1 type II toxin-antitoxin system RelE/ParE family toxin [Marinobacter sp. M4C]UQG65096.1 type II toxin-antitoxin system RelE/ParE family toxin [Marinobacter sp. M2C]UQG69375.1 type II toxin-antitoxin system RelE/ParE fami